MIFNPHFSIKPNLFLIRKKYILKLKKYLKIKGKSIAYALVHGLDGEGSVVRPPSSRPMGRC